MATYSLRPENITSSYNMATPKVSEQVDSAVSIAVDILTSSVFSLVAPVSYVAIPESTGSALVPGESSSSLSPSIVVIATSTTTNLQLVGIDVPVTTSSSTIGTTDNTSSGAVSTPFPYVVSTVVVAPSSTIDTLPSVTISPSIISYTVPVLLTSAISSTNSTLIPSYIVPTTLTTLTFPSTPTESPSSNNSNPIISTAPDPTTSNKPSSTHIGAYIGAAVGGVILLVLLLLSIICLTRRRKYKHPKHHPDRPAFIGGYELKLDKVGDLQRVVHEKRVRRKTFEAWKRGVVPDLDPDDVAGQSEFNFGFESPKAAYSNSLADINEEVWIPNQRVREEGEELVGDDHDVYVVSPIEDEQRGRGWLDEQKPERPISGIKPLIFEWEQRADSRSRSPTGMARQVL
ncbi:hypothetical protein MFRU_004g03180 [Monilinia fructicola]|nr:hypothetical protein MFRU_004g03180 [Monilinia fructicola]